MGAARYISVTPRISWVMQDVLIRNGTLLDPVTGDVRRADIIIRNGIITAVGEQLPSSGLTPYDAAGKFVSPGWIDMHVHLREPGLEYKETIASGCRAAAFGGFTEVACLPNTEPPIDSAEVILAIQSRAQGLPVNVYPIACVSKGRKGRELAPLFELKTCGAVAFSDDGSPVQSGHLMRRALEYASMLDRPIVNHMEDLHMGPKGHMHEGAVSARLGVPPVPALSEESMLARDLLLAELTGGHLHVAHISTSKSVALVRQAKASGVPVTAEACTHHFALTDLAVEESGFSTQTKMHPPLRSQADTDAIKEGLEDGTIDAICTDHAPHAAFEKNVEFTAAPFGIIGLESAWGLIGRHLVAEQHLDVAAAVHKVCVAPRKILRLPVPEIREGAHANLTIFDATTKWTFAARHIRSKSSNTPFLGARMTGKAWAIYNNGQLVDNGD